MTHQIFPQPVRSYASVRQRTAAHEYVYWRPDNNASVQQSSHGRHGSPRSLRRNLADALALIAGMIGFIVWLHAGGIL